MVLGATTLPHRFDIFRPSGPFTMPCVMSRVTGSSVGTSPSSFITRVQKRKYSRCIVPCFSLLARL